ncbi:hypothetical protein MHUMG1_03457 [Metarhizium humberi]|uniref:Phosphomethylpyrimidine kinase type-1 n=1 Tax=Metarhizium humberi TaxID=2596975 RepID=A0A9P8MEN5_9HYPO|nr:hypothetical protein MHUMG1_03457 [Metarhizium humberi]
MVKGRVLVIAGSDCSGGAGLEADQKVLAAHGCYAMTATTALTAQNTTGVKGIHVIPAAFVEQQIEACIEDVGVDVIKTGMLAAAKTIDMIARQVAKHGITSLVVDPVMVSTSGAQLLPREAIRELSMHLLPRATVLTPNIPEAILILSENGDSALAEKKICSVSDVEFIGRRIQALGPEWVLVKGGHLPFRADMSVAETEHEKHVVVDLLVGPEGKVFRVQSPYQPSTSTHGTGCSLASAIAAGLAKGIDVPAAVHSACRYIEAGIRSAPKLGKGNGPLDHFHSIQSLPFAPDIESIGRANKIVSYIIHEMQLHVNYCKQFGISEEEIQATEEKQACTAYTRYVLDVGQSEDWLALQMALAPCLLGYGAVAQMLHSHRLTRTKDNIYWPWIQNYVAEDYTSAVRLGSGEFLQRACPVLFVADIFAPPSGMPELLEKHMRLQSPSRVEELIKIFIHGTKMETGFWEMFPYK